MFEQLCCDKAFGCFVVSSLFGNIAHTKYQSTLSFLALNKCRASQNVNRFVVGTCPTRNSKQHACTISAFNRSLAAPPPHKTLTCTMSAHTTF